MRRDQLAKLKAIEKRLTDAEESVAQFGRLETESKHKPLTLTAGNIDVVIPESLVLTISTIVKDHLTSTVAATAKELEDE